MKKVVNPVNKFLSIEEGGIARKKDEYFLVLKVEGSMTIDFCINKNEDAIQCYCIKKES